MIPLPIPPKVVQKSGNKAVFEVEALYPGYGLTLGNCLRRVLLSSLEGAAATQMKIKGVNHEFSTIPGVLEDVVIIMLNLKKLRFKSFSEEPQVATLNIKGEKEVKGKDFKLSSGLELVNPDVHIATLTKPSANLGIEVKVEKGIGYLPVEGREEGKTEIGVIPLDAFFNPVRRVNFKVENMRVGKRTDFDKLSIEIETDGTIPPEEAIDKSLTILLDHFSLFSEEFKKILGPKQGKRGEKDEEDKKEDQGPKELKVEDLKISERTKNALLKNNIKTVGGILRKNEKDLLTLDGLGDSAIKEIKKVLKKLGLELKEE